MKLSPGARFGRLTVREMIGETNRGYRYLCECDCGTVKAIWGTALSVGDTKSCGCLRREKSHANLAKARAVRWERRG